MNSKRMTVIGVVFVLSAFMLYYVDSLTMVFDPLHQLLRFSYFLPRLIDFLFYGGLTLVTLSVVLAQKREAVRSVRRKPSKTKEKKMPEKSRDEIVSKAIEGLELESRP